MEVKRFSPWTDLGVLTGIFLAATVVTGVCMAVSAMVVPEMERGVLLFVTYVLQFTLAIVGGVLWLMYRGGVGMRFGVSWADGPMVLAGIFLVTAAGIAIEPLLTLFPAHYLEKLDGMIGRGGWAVLMTVVAAPILEEVFFRGLVLESLSRRWGGRAAVLVSSALFGLVHFPILPQMVNAFVIGIVMGYIYLRTRSLVSVIAIHAINNGLAYMMLELTGSQGTDTRGMIGNHIVYLLVYVTSVVIVAASLVLLDRKERTKNDEITLQKKTCDE